MKRPSDAHWDLVNDRSYALAREGLAAIQALEIDFVLAGGWAVFAHVPQVPSIDLDIFVAPSSMQEAKQALVDAGVTVGPGQEAELLDLDAPVELYLLGEPDLGLPHPSYRPARLLHRRVVHKTVRFPHPLERVPVPTAPALAITKAGALANRNLTYRAFNDGEARMQLGPSLVPMLLARSESYYLRKAGKDLLDVSLLVRPEAIRRETAALVTAFELQEAIDVMQSQIHPDVANWARDAAQRIQAADPLETLAEL